MYFFFLLQASVPTVKHSPQYVTVDTTTWHNFTRLCHAQWLGGTHWITTILTRVRTKITTLTYTGFLKKLSVKDAEITLTASWITDPLLHELIILIVQSWRTVPLVAFYFSPSYSIVRAATAMNRTMLAKFCSQFCFPPLQLLPCFICERYVEPNEGIPNF